MERYISYRKPKNLINLNIEMQKQKLYFLHSCSIEKKRKDRVPTRYINYLYRHTQI